MVRYLFILLLSLHAIIHLPGFIKAYGQLSIKHAPVIIRRRQGVWWLLSAVLLLVSIVLLLFKKDSWCVIAIIAVFISQVLIVMNWKDARYGTIVNVIILLAAVPSYASMRFNTMVSTESRTLLARVSGEQPAFLSAETIAGLPPVVLKWLTRSGVTGKEKANTIRLKQTGTLRTSVSGKWMPFEAKEYFSVNLPAFVWVATVDAMPLIYLDGRDKYGEGHGEMVISALSLIKLANAVNDKKTDTAAMIRYLAEICWFPSAAASSFITWKQTDSLSAIATMSYDNMQVSGVFKFTKDGDMDTFSAYRYYTTGKNARTEKWLVQSVSWKTFDGVRIPNKSKVTWQLKSGDFNWANIEVTAIDFNCKEIYP